MSRRNGTGRWGRIVWGILLVVLLPILYALSIGPVIWLGQRGYLPPVIVPALEVFYQPLMTILRKMIERETAAAATVVWYADWYVNLWVP